MLALVATPRFLLLVDLDARRVSIVEDARREYYGITWRPKGVRPILSHSGLDNETLVDLQSYALSEVGWVSEGAAQSHRVLSQPHQILCGPDGRVICTNTGRNSVIVVDLEKPGHYQEARLHADRWDRLEPTVATGLHLNSLFLKDDRLFVLAHGFEAGSQLITLDYPSLEMVETMPIVATGMHNYCATERGERIACVSSLGALIDPHTLQVHWRSASAGYLRGLAVGPERVIVGESPQAGRHLRAAAMSGLWVIDRTSWQTVEYLPLGPFGVVNEVRLLDEPDEAHHGHLFGGLEWLKGQDRLGQVAVEQVQASRQLAALTKDGPFELVLGAPHVMGGGWWDASAELCLMLTRNLAQQELGLAYDFGTKADGGQCGVVVGCKEQPIGTCTLLRDTNMDVIVVTKRGLEGVSLAHWKHDGASWIRCRIVADLDGLQGRLMIRRDGDEVVVLAGADRGEVGRLPAADLPYLDQQWGVRWQATRIAPGQPGTGPST